MRDSGFDLTGCRAIVTGASPGIGAAVATRLAGAGATVVAVSRSGGVPSSSESINPLVADLSDSEQTDSLVQRAVAVLGGLDVLVNNAGRGDSLPMVDMNREYFDGYMETPTCGHRYDSVRRPINTFLQVQIPLVIMMGSVDAERPSPGSVVYGATKAALGAATVALSKEWMGEGIRVNQVNPGLIDTPLTSEIVDLLNTSEEHINIAGRAGLPDEVAGLVHYLVAPVGRFANGTSFRVDGGALALGPFDRWQR
ncbi:MAG: 3-ketoacyl-ACP reductase [Pseudomonadota bacterium]|nr:MAG: 3-ketoacyl-ACP reductase [Pseudomonadota bacterium]